MSDAADRLRLARTEGVGPITYRRLLARFGDATAAIAALPEIARAAGRRATLPVPNRHSAERELEAVAKLGGQMLFLGAPGYPPLLATLDDPPPALAVMGDPTLASRRAVGIVGSRNASANGRRIAEILAAGLADAGFVVISGLARGIDTSAHVGALGRGATIACIAGGIDTFYPPENAALQRRIGSEGAVFAELPPGVAAQARHFPRRNRVIAGLSLGVVVVEAALKSGSLITARLAAEANREVFAVPGSPLDERCRGTNGLLRDGAHLTETAEDVIALLSGGLAQAPLYEATNGFAEPVPAAELPPGAHAAALQTIVNLLGPAPTAVDDLIRRCQLPASVVMSVLLDLEIAGRIETLSGHRIALLATWGG
ncbi:MAG: DNA-processing protein DprA [Alphaproteobacteria bacterium]|nr:DNA-processing protein DprA [Alphaproteobacteria bacterium]